MTDDLQRGKCPFGFDAPAGSDRAEVLVTPAMSREHLPRMAPAPIEPGDGGLPTGRCLCGKITFRIDRPVSAVFVNYDEASRRWTGGLAMTMVLRATGTTFHNWGYMVHFASSDRERHCFCRVCGSSVLVRYVDPPAMNGMVSLSAGVLDRLEGLELKAETYADERPDFITLEGDHRRLSAGEIRAMFASPAPA